MYDLAHVAGWDPLVIRMIWHIFPGLDLFHADPAQPLTTVGQELDDRDHDTPDLSEELKSPSLTVIWLFVAGRMPPRVVPLGSSGNYLSCFSQIPDVVFYTVPQT